MAFKKEKIESLIKEELSLALMQRVSDTSLGLVTITKVKISPDYKLATVYFSVYEKENREQFLSKLEELKGMLRSELAKRTRLRYTPALRFFIDDTLDYVEKMDSLFRQIRKEDDNKDNE